MTSLPKWSIAREKESSDKHGRSPILPKPAAGDNIKIIALQGKLQLFEPENSLL